jgi:hypothetical protein
LEFILHDCIPIQLNWSCLPFFILCDCICNSTK